ncbi:alpha/beta hydrolase [Sphingobium amiense]|uniref:Alpha/beta hydrolase n=1 Tax=Sphingobium amiense TaxID=135719 RepID=A0A494W4K3_9SPHN|nr:alpha/beta hydrolase [Sphingobium amiense]BBD98098.1 alpha/beta hydrolase [Sphingobium amiense]
MPTQHPSVAQARTVKDHISGLIARSDEMEELPVAMRYVMDNYTLTGAERELVCATSTVDLGTCAGEWFVPPQVKPGHHIVYVHGGGWFAGSVDTHRHLIDLLARTTGRAVFAPNYRLAPEHPFPAGLDDARRAYFHACAHGPAGPMEVASVALMGDSAGGNLSAALVIDLVSRNARLPDALALLSGVVDFRPPDRMPPGSDDPTCEPTTQTKIAELYLQGVTTVDDPLVSPAAAGTDILERFPPTIIQASSDEYLRDQDVAFAAALWRLGVTVHLSIWPHLPHAFHLFPQELPEAGRAVAEIAAFLEGVEAAPVDEFASVGAQND